MKRRFALMLCLICIFSFTACSQRTPVTAGPPETAPDWGITLTAEDVTPTGLTILCTQTGGAPTGELSTGTWYTIKKATDAGWVTVEYLPQEYDIAWNDLALLITMEGETRWEVDWEWLYGELPPGTYCIGKEFMDFRGAGDYDEALIYAEFTID